MESTLLSNNISKQKEMDTTGNKRLLTRKKNKGKNEYFKGNVCKLSPREKSNMSVTSNVLKKKKGMLLCYKQIQIMDPLNTKGFSFPSPCTYMLLVRHFKSIDSSAAFLKSYRVGGWRFAAFYFEDNCCSFIQIKQQATLHHFQEYFRARSKLQV